MRLTLLFVPIVLSLACHLPETLEAHRFSNSVIDFKIYNDTQQPVDVVFYAKPAGQGERHPFTRTVNASTSLVVKLDGFRMTKWIIPEIEFVGPEGKVSLSDVSVVSGSHQNVVRFRKDFKGKLVALRLEMPRSSEPSESPTPKPAQPTGPQCLPDGTVTQSPSECCTSSKHAKCKPGISGCGFVCCSNTSNCAN